MSSLRSKADLKLVLSGRAANNCGFNRSMQHLSSNYRAEDVAYEVPTEDLLHRYR